jgi:hypothetical protein
MSRFAYDSFRRFVHMYGDVVLGVDHHAFETRIAALRSARGVAADTELSAEDLAGLVDEYLALVEETTGAPFPTDPEAQLWGAVAAVFDSWKGDRAVAYRRHNRIPDDLGTAVNVQAMVYGNMGDGFGERRGIHPRPEHGGKAVLRRVPPERAGRGRGGRDTGPAPHRGDGGDPARAVRRAPARPAACSRSTTRTCRTWSSPWSAAGSTCSRRGVGSGRQRRRSASPWRWWTRA